MTDPTNVFAMDDIKFMTGYNVEPVVASETAVIDGDSEVLPQRRAPRAASSIDGGAVGAEHARDGQQGPRGAAGSSTTGGDGRGPRRAGGDQRRGAGQAGRGGAGRPAGQRRADVGHSEGRERHPHRAVRERAARAVPHRRDSLQHHEPADEVPRRDRVARQDHGEARHRREAAAAGRPHQDPLQRERRREGDRLPRVRACRRSSARRSSCVCSTRTS